MESAEEFHSAKDTSTPNRVGIKFDDKQFSSSENNGPQSHITLKSTYYYYYWYRIYIIFLILRSYTVLY